MSQYRDPLAGLRSQVATKRAVLDDRERALTPIMRALLHEPLRRSLAELRPRAVAPAETMEALSDADAALDGLLVAHEQAASQLPRLRESDDDVPDPARPRMEPPWLYEEPYLLRLRDLVKERLLRVDLAAPLARFGDRAYISRFHIGGAPFTFAIVADPMQEALRETVYEAFLRTSVPPSLPSLDLRRQGAHHTVGKALHLAREIEIGIPDFDELFWITGDEVTAAIFTTQVRAALDYLSERAPVLHVGSGMATFSWTGVWGSEVTDVLPDAALDVLVAIRAAIETG